MDKEDKNIRIEEDRRLMKKFQQGDKQAFRALVDRYHREAIAYANSILKDWSLAEDAAQEALISIYQNAGDFKAEMVFKTWLLRIVRNQSFNDRRKRRLANLTKFNFKSEQPKRKAPPTPEHQTQRTELRGHLGRALKQLPEKYRTAVELCDLQGLSANEAARITGYSPNTIFQHVRRGRLRMQEYLVEECGLSFDELLADLED